MDTGSETVGCAAIANGKVIYQKLKSKYALMYQKRYSAAPCTDVLAVAENAVIANQDS